MQSVLAMPWDLENGPVIRLTVWREEEKDSLLLCAHHVALDGWSLDTVLQDLGELYHGGALAGPAPPGPREHAEWQADWIPSPSGQLQWSYWQRALANCIGEDLVLPADRDALRSGGGTYSCVVAGRMHRLRAWCHTN